MERLKLLQLQLLQIGQHPLLKTLTGRSNVIVQLGYRLDVGLGGKALHGTQGQGPGRGGHEACSSGEHAWSKFMCCEIEKFKHKMCRKKIPSEQSNEADNIGYLLMLNRNQRTKEQEDMKVGNAQHPISGIPSTSLPILPGDACVSGLQYGKCVYGLSKRILYSR